jgi:TolA-binding protein
LLPATAAPRAPAPPAFSAAPAIATPAASEPSPLAAEVASLESARAALASGRPGDALGALDRYGRDFPRGHLSPEAAVLRIQALATAGDRARSRALADAFLRDHPDSPYAPRLRPFASAP